MRLARTHREAPLRSMRGVYVDAGKRDDWLPRSRMAGGLSPRGPLGGGRRERVFFELFDARHTQVEYRYPGALRWIVDQIR